jgi:hypothetical protein
MRRRLSPEGLDMRDGTPENCVFRVFPDLRDYQSRRRLCAARDHDTRRDPHAKFCVNDAQRAAVAAASGDAIGGL